MPPPSAIGNGFEAEAITDTEAIVVPNPLTVKAVAARRIKAGRLVAKTAAATSSDLFKTPVGHLILIERQLLISPELWKAKSKAMGPYVAPIQINPLLTTTKSQKTTSASKQKQDSPLA